MKKQIVGLVVLMALGIAASAQDIIYLTNGNQFENLSLVEIDSKKIYFLDKRGDSEIKRPFKRSGVAMIFRKDGRYLLMSELEDKAELAQKQLEEYLSSPPRSVGYDVIIAKAKPVKIVVGTISYESEDVINYENEDGNAASINKKEVLAVFYKDGNHQIVKDPDEVAEALLKARKEIAAVETKIAKPIEEAAATPAPEPTPEPATPEPEPAKPVEQEPASSVNTTPSEPVAAAPKTKPSKNKGRPAKNARAMPTLNENEYQGYRQKGIDKVKEFEAYLNIIANKTTDPDEKDKAIEQAAKLFIPGSTIEVTSLNKPGTSKYEIKDYLTRLKLLPYASAKLEWVNVGYVKELKQEADGNYYGTITGEQTFVGLDNSGQPLYSDITKKNVKVRLNSYQKQIEGAETLQWELLLGSIGIEVGK